MLLALTRFRYRVLELVWRPLRRRPGRRGVGIGPPKVV